MDNNRPNFPGTNSISNDDVKSQLNMLEKKAYQESHMGLAKEQREKENNKEIKNIGKLISAMEQSNKNNEKLSKRMLWLTIATTFLAIVQIIVAIVKS